MEGAETQLTKGYNHRAVKELDVVLAKLRGMDVGNTLFRAQVRWRSRGGPSPRSGSQHEEPTTRHLTTCHPTTCHRPG